MIARTIGRSGEGRDIVAAFSRAAEPAKASP